MKKTIRKNEKGITLIALVITVIVLIILAGISIMMISGNDGILNRVATATETQGNAQINEAMSLIYNEYVTENKLGENTGNFKEFVKGKNKMDENGVINTKKLVGGKLALGNGNGNTDVYKLEEIENGYAVYYYGKKENESGKLIWKSEGSTVNEEVGIKTALNTAIVWDDKKRSPAILVDIYDNYSFEEKEKIMGGKEAYEEYKAGNISLNDEYITPPNIKNYDDFINIRI